ncbi:MAG: alanine--tRNA ligase [Rickettsiales bacterium]|nr:alanine--tRNA ligase [Rickettsiales bacterium]
MTSTADIRAGFLRFFEKKDHIVMPSSPLIPHNDPTLMFTNAGMNQFKNIFTGAETAPNPPRATTSQKCVRAGGKHNDLDNVGYTARHHTFFEMLGNFSFGDYFKEGVIEYAWEMLTKTFELDPDKLYFTVYHDDDEAFNAWKKITGCSDDRILRVPTSDNFWSMGDTGPCGPCSEIFYDHGVGNGEWRLDANGYDLFDERYVEIWNLVFMQFEQVDANTRIPLPKPCVDTGMGLERMATVLQGKHNNYDIDLFQHLIATIEDESSTKSAGDHLASHRVIADHLRSSGFLIADGVLPSNEGRGYVLRRIMRRAMRHAHLLGCKDPLMYKLVPTLIKEMGAHFSELGRAQALITETLKLEEERFKQTLERGLKLLDEARTAMGDGEVLDGQIAFKLYDTYGFPLDLTEDILRGDNQRVDLEGFNAAMAEQKARAKAAWAGSGDAAVQTIWFDIKDRCGATEFVGYQSDTTQGTIDAIVVDGKEVDVIMQGESGFIVTNQTVCYGESGGQQGDTGTMHSGEENVALIEDCQKPIDGLHVHAIKMNHGELRKGESVEITIDDTRRSRLRANHSATHILHEVLRRQLGDHVTQKGSLVAEDRLRFDLSHPKQITREELAEVEAEVNRVIWQNTEVVTKLMEKDQAIEAGAMAMFGEKYDDEVRVLFMGVDDGYEKDNLEHRGEQAGTPFSVELCGGTHVQRTGDIGLFKIISEGAVAAGVRRIEAVTNADAFTYLNDQDATLTSLAQELKTKPEGLADMVAKMATDKKQLEKQLADAKKQLAMGGSGGGDIAPEDLAGIPFIGKSFDDLPPKELRDLVTSLAKKHGNAVVALASSFEGKASIIVASGQEKVDAPTLVRAASEIVGGKGGGGKPNFAQAGGPDGGKTGDAIATIKGMVEHAA